RHRSFTAMPASASRRKPMICSSVKRFFTSNLRRLRDWTPNRRATQNRGDVDPFRPIHKIVVAHSMHHLWTERTLGLHARLHRTQPIFIGLALCLDQASSAIHLEV